MKILFWVTMPRLVLGCAVLSYFWRIMPEAWRSIHKEIAEGILGGKCLLGSLSGAQHWSLLQNEEYKLLETPVSLQSALVSGLELYICTHVGVTHCLDWVLMIFVAYYPGKWSYIKYIYSIILQKCNIIKLTSGETILFCKNLQFLQGVILQV